MNIPTPFCTSASVRWERFIDVILLVRFYGKCFDSIDDLPHWTKNLAFICGPVFGWLWDSHAWHPQVDDCDIKLHRHIFDSGTCASIYGTGSISFASASSILFSQHPTYIFFIYPPYMRHIQTIWHQPWVILEYYLGWPQFHPKLSLHCRYRYHPHKTFSLCDTSRVMELSLDEWG